MNKPIYPHNPIGSLYVLARVLGIKDVNEFLFIAQNSDNYFFIAKKEKKRDGSLRITHDVKPKLKYIHRKITNNLLKKVIYPKYLQGALPKRDYQGNASIHANSKLIITEDIKNFFPSINKDVVINIWKNVFHFPQDVSEILAELITYKGYLVQGGIASSYIANLALLDKEADLVAKLAKKGFTYTRYVDDISISSKRAITKKEKTKIIKDIHIMLRSIGVKLNRKKHEIMPRNARQKIHRLNVNTYKPTISKLERDKISSAVYQCKNTYKTSCASKEYAFLFNSTLGRVNMLCRFHPSSGKKLKDKLNSIKPTI